MPHPAALTFQVAPAAHQARRQVLQPGELDLQFAFVAAGASAKDFEDEARAVEHLDRERIDRDASMVHGNTEGMHLLGLNDAAEVRWSALAAQLGENGTWLQELEQAIATRTKVRSEADSLFKL